MDDKGDLLVGAGWAMKTESVVIKPFFGLPQGDMDQWLNEIECRFGDDDEYAIRESATIGLSARASFPSFRTPPLPSGVLQALDVCKLELLVLMSDEGRKMQKVLEATSLNEFRQGGEFECRVPAGIDWTSPQGAILSLLICSLEMRTREPGLPFRKHSAVAGRHVGINRNAPGEDFPICFLSEEQFRDRHYHPHSLALVEITPDDLTAETMEETNIRVLVHEKLKGVLALGPTSKKGRLAQRIVMESVINQIADAASEGDFPEKSLGHRLRTKLSRRLSGASLTSSKVTITGATQGSFQLVEGLHKL